MSVPDRSLHAQTNPDGTLDPRYPNGDKPLVAPASLGINTAAFNAAAIDLTNLPQNTSFSQNYRQFLTGTAASTATITVSAITGTLGNWAISVDSLVNSTSAVGSGSLMVTADDGAGTVVSFPVQVWSILLPVQQHLINDIPGIWWIPTSIQGGSSPASDITSINQIKARTTNGVGWGLYKRWAQLENPSLVGGNAQYDGSWDSRGDSGWAGIDKIMAADPTRSFALMLYHSTTSVTTSFPSGLAPAYLGGSTYGVTSGAFFGGCYSATSRGSLVRYWNAAVMGRLSAMVQAYARHYANNPRFHMIDPFSEISGVGFAGYSDSELFASLTSTNMIAACRAAGPTLKLVSKPTFLGGTSSYPQYFNMMKAGKWSVMDFDTANETGTHPGSNWLGYAYRGLNPANHPPTAGSPGFVDYSQVWDYMCQIGSDELGDKANDSLLPSVIGSGVVSDYFATKIKAVNAGYVFVLNNSWTGPSQNRIGSTHPDLIDTMNGMKPPRTAYPPLLQ